MPPHVFTFKSIVKSEFKLSDMEMSDTLAVFFFILIFAQEWQLGRFMIFFSIFFFWRIVRGRAAYWNGKKSSTDDLRKLIVLKYPAGEINKIFMPNKKTNDIYEGVEGTFSLFLKRMS